MPMRRIIVLSVWAAFTLIILIAGAGEVKPIQTLKEAILFYEGCESVKGRNTDKGIIISSATLVDGKIGKALLLERRYANILSNGDFASNTGWIAVGAPKFLGEGGYGDPACVRITEADFLRQVVSDMTDKRWYCLSVYAKAEGAQAGLQLRVDDETMKDFPVTNEYRRFVLPFQARFANSTVTLRALGQGNVIVDCAQLEDRRTFPSTFCPNKRRPGQSIKVPITSQTLNVNEGTIAFWMRPLWIGETGSGRNLFAWGNPNKPRVENLVLAVYPGGKITDHNHINRIFLKRTGAKKTFGVKSFPLCEWLPGTWHHVAAVWKAKAEGISQLMLYMDGKPMLVKYGPWGEIKQPKIMYFGYWRGCYADAVLDEIYVFKRALSEKEVGFLFDLITPMPLF